MITLEERIARFTAQYGIELASPPVPPAPPSYQCDTCGDVGWLLVRSADCPQGEAKACPNPDCAAAHEQRAHSAARQLQRSGLPARYAALSFESWYALDAAFRQGKELAAGAAWMFSQSRPFSLNDAALAAGYEATGDAEERAWLVLQGGLGVGKTGLAAAAINEMVFAGRSALYYRTGELFADIQSRYGQSEGVSADTLIDSIKSAAVLVLDEMNVPRASDDKQRIVEEIIRYRHGNDLPTLITCNVTTKEFAGMWGERTADVIFEQAHWIIVQGARLRRSAKVQESF